MIYPEGQHVPKFDVLVGLYFNVEKRLFSTLNR